MNEKQGGKTNLDTLDGLDQITLLQAPDDFHQDRLREVRLRLDASDPDTCYTVSAGHTLGQYMDWILKQVDSQSARSLPMLPEDLIQL